VASHSPTSSSCLRVVTLGPFVLLDLVFFLEVVVQAFDHFVLDVPQDLLVVAHWVLFLLRMIRLKSIRHDISSVVLIVLSHVCSFDTRLLLVLQNEGWRLRV